MYATRDLSSLDHHPTTQVNIPGFRWARLRHQTLPSFVHAPMPPDIEGDNLEEEGHRRIMSSVRRMSRI